MEHHERRGSGPGPVSGRVSPVTAERETADVPLEELLVLAARVGEALGSRGLTLATAESCTGGLVGHLLTEIPGSSAWYVGGGVVYSDELKRRMAAVPADLLATHGAVSAAVAEALATGIRTGLDVDVGISVTGIAGPTGATPTKPVGLVFVGVAAGDGAVVERHLWDGDRSANKRASAAAVLRLLLERVR
jgi:PncC family amidohydrolase